MPTPIFLGDFEQLILLAILHLGQDAAVLDVKDHIDELTARRTSRGALYRTLDRMEDKGWVAWSVDEEDIPERGGRPRKRFRVTREGVAVLRDARATLLDLWEGLEGVLG